MEESEYFLKDLYTVFQPIVYCSDTPTIDRYEILLRSHQESGFPQNAFSWFIEDERRNAQLMGFYVDTLTKLMATHCDTRWSLNLHPKQLQHPSTWHFLDLFSFKKEYLSLELTEHFCEFNQPEKVNMLYDYISKLKKTGFSIAIDDVGSGQNNLEMIANNTDNIHTIKISLLNFMNLNEGVMFRFLDSWLNLSQHYQLNLIVEGVESEYVSKKLTQLGILYQQGYYHGHGKLFD